MSGLLLDRTQITEKKKKTCHPQISLSLPYSTSSVSTYAFASLEGSHPRRTGGGVQCGYSNGHGDHQPYTNEGQCLCFTTGYDLGL